MQAIRRTVTCGSVHTGQGNPHVPVSVSSHTGKDHFGCRAPRRASVFKIVVLCAWTAGVIDTVDHDGWRLIGRDTLRFYRTPETARHRRLAQYHWSRSLGISPPGRGLRGLPVSIGGYSTPCHNHRTGGENDVSHRSSCLSGLPV